MKTTYIAPEMTVVRLQHHSIICNTSPNSFDGRSLNMSSGEGNQVSNENSVWTKESHNIWDEEW